MRMEDLDTPRVVPGMADDILRTLELLGLEWDGPVVWQSRRTDAYEAAFEELHRQGYVYPCGCSRADLSRSASAPHPGEDGPAYPGTCRNGMEKGRGARAFRVRVADEEIAFTDAVTGECRQNLASACGDFVIRRKDGLFAYQLAVVVDDADMGVNQVVRGADLLSSTPRQIWLQRLLALPTPVYAHLPLVTEPDGSKLSKRNRAVSLVRDHDLAEHGGRLIAAALSFLGIPVAEDLYTSSCQDVLEWGLANFDPVLVPRHSGPLLVLDLIQA
jgi:glutamyl-Q tRNA(Asp) synthetase